MAINSYTVGPGKLAFGPTASATSYEAQITNATIHPEIDTDDDVPVLSGETDPGAQRTTWHLTGTALQDIGAANGFANYCYDHDGETVAFSYTPNSALGVKYDGSVRIAAIDVGGDVQSKPTSDFDFTCAGKPTRTMPSGG